MSYTYFVEYRFIDERCTTLLTRPVDFILNSQNIFFVRTVLRKNPGYKFSTRIRLVHWSLADSDNKNHRSFGRDLIIEIKKDSLK